MYEIGSSPFFAEVTPGLVTDLPEEKEAATERPVTMLPRQPDEPEGVFMTYKPQEETTEEEEFPTETTSETPTEYPTSYPEAKTTLYGYTEPETGEPDFGSDWLTTEYPQSEAVTTPPAYIYPEWGQTTKPNPSEPRYPDEAGVTNPVYEPSEPTNTIPETSAPRISPSEPSEPRSPESDPAQPRYTNPEPVELVPPYSRPHQPQIVVVDEDEDLNVNGKPQKLINIRCLKMGENIWCLSNQKKSCVVLSIRCLFLQCLPTILRHAPTTGTSALLLRTVAITATGTAATAGLVFTVMERIVSQKVRGI